MLNFKQNLYIDEHDFQDSEPKTLSRGPGDIQTSKDISGIEVRLSNVLVKDNKTKAIFPFPGYAKVYFLTIVACDLSEGSLLLDLKGFEKVDDGDSLNVDKTLFYWKKGSGAEVAPSQIHVFSSLIKSKQPLRDVASVLSDIQRDDSYKLLAGTLQNLLKTATALTDVSNLVFNIAGIVGKYLGNVEDKPLLSWFQSFTDINGDFDVLGKTAKQAANKHASMSLSIVIRDKARMEEEATEEQKEKIVM